MHKKWGAFLTVLFVFVLLLSGCSNKKDGLSKTDLTNLYIQSVNNHADVINGYVDTYKTGKNHIVKPSNKELDWISSTKRRISMSSSSSEKINYFSNYLGDLKSETNEYKNNYFSNSISLNDDFNTDLKKVKKSLDIDSNKSKKLIKARNKINKAQKRLKNTNINQEIRPDKKDKIFTPSINTGRFKITGLASPYKTITLTSIDDDKFIHQSTTTDFQGYFIFKVFYSGAMDKKCWISYKDKTLKAFKTKITIKANTNFKDTQAIDTPNTSVSDTNQSSEDNSDDQSTKRISKPKATSEDKAALRKAVDYSDISHLSKQGIYEQLTSSAEGFPAEAAQYAIDNMTGDWNHNALMKAKDYRSTMNMSNDDIYNQLISSAEGFTSDQASYAIQHLDD